MALTTKIYAEDTISITDLRTITTSYLEKTGDSAVAILSHNKPAAYLLSSNAYEALLDKIEDIELTKTAKARLHGKTVKVSLEDL